MKKIIYQGERIPRFYLPVRQDNATLGTEFWIFPLAWIVVLYNAFRGSYLWFYEDLRQWANRLEDRDR